MNELENARQRRDGAYQDFNIVKDEYEPARKRLDEYERAWLEAEEKLRGIKGGQ